MARSCAPSDRRSKTRPVRISSTSDSLCVSSVGGRSGAVDQLFFSDDVVERDVVRLCRQRVDFLKTVADSDQERRQWARARLQESKAVIVVTRAHAETVTGAIKRDEWQQHQFNLLRREDRRSLALGFRNTIAIRTQR